MSNGKMGDGFAGVSHSAVSKANQRFSAKVKKNETLGKPRTEFQTRYPMARVPPRPLWVGAGGVFCDHRSMDDPAPGGELKKL